MDICLAFGEPWTIDITDQDIVPGRSTGSDVTFSLVVSTNQLDYHGPGGSMFLEHQEKFRYLTRQKLPIKTSEATEAMYINTDPR